MGVHSEVSLTDGDHKPALLYAKHKHMLLWGSHYNELLGFDALQASIIVQQVIVHNILEECTLFCLVNHSMVCYVMVREAGSD